MNRVQNRSIVFLASGTRGDVQPYVALASELLRRGRHVTIATHASFRALVEQAGVPFALLDANPSDLLTQPRFSAALRVGRNPLHSLRATIKYMREGREWYARLLHSAWVACQSASASLVIGGVPTLWASDIAQALEVPHLFAFLQPMTRTTFFPSALLPTTQSLGRWGNALSYRLIEQAIWLPWRNVINQWRRETLGLPALQASPLRHLHRQTVLYGYSVHVAPQPKDWPMQHHVTGYWFADATDACLSDEVERFLAKKDDVVYIGFGVGSLQRPAVMLQMIGQALAEKQLRAIMLWPQPIPSAQNQNMLFVNNAPHATLFPRVWAAVHHGGAGTTAQAIRAGVPSVVLPAMADQYFWGARVAALGIGPMPIPQHTLTVRRLVETLCVTTQGVAVRARAQTLGMRVRLEDGVNQAVDVITSILSSS